MQDAELEYGEEPLDDWPLEGERGLAWSCTELRRSDRSWLQHHDMWKRESGVGEHDRSVHEHHALCLALHHFCTYDQLQVVNVAGCEALNARRQLIEHAHKGHPLAPRWDGAEDFLGYRTQIGGTMIDPRRIAHVAARRSQRANIITATLKAKEAESAWLRRGKPEGESEKEKKGKDKGGRGGKGAQATPSSE